MPYSITKNGYDTIYIYDNIVSSVPNDNLSAGDVLINKAVKKAKELLKNAPKRNDISTNRYIHKLKDLITRRTAEALDSDPLQKEADLNISSKTIELRCHKFHIDETFDEICTRKRESEEPIGVDIWLDAAGFIYFIGAVSFSDINENVDGSFTNYVNEFRQIASFISDQDNEDYSGSTYKDNIFYNSYHFDEKHNKNTVIESIETSNDEMQSLNFDIPDFKDFTSDFKEKVYLSDILLKQIRKIQNVDIHFKSTAPDHSGYYDRERKYYITNTAGASFTMGNVGEIQMYCYDYGLCDQKQTVCWLISPDKKRVSFGFAIHRGFHNESKIGGDRHLFEEYYQKYRED